MTDAKPCLAGLTNKLLSRGPSHDSLFGEMVRDKYMGFLRTVYNWASDVWVFFCREPADSFYGVYSPLTARSETLFTGFKCPENTFEQYNRILLMGSAGAGKTTMLRNIALSSIATGYKVPVCIHLPSVNLEKPDLKSLLCRKIFENWDWLCSQNLQNNLLNGDFLIMLDGYDELPSLYRLSVLKHIELFMAEFDRNRYIITARPGTELAFRSLFVSFDLQDLTDDEIDAFVCRMNIRPDKKRRILSSRMAKMEQKQVAWERNPMALTMYTFLYDLEQLQPEKRSVLYEKLYEKIYEQHFSLLKAEHIRQRSSGLGIKKLKSILGRLAFNSWFNNECDFSEEDIALALQKMCKENTPVPLNTKGVLHDLHSTMEILQKSGDRYSFCHLSFRDYFACWYISRASDNWKIRLYSPEFTDYQWCDADISYEYLSFLHEMDTDMFDRYCLLPRLLLVKKVFENTRERDRIDSIANFLFQLDDGLVAYTFNAKILQYLNIISSKELECELKINIFENEACLRRYIARLLSINIFEDKKSFNYISNILNRLDKQIGQSKQRLPAQHLGSL